MRTVILHWRNNRKLWDEYTDEAYSAQGIGGFRAFVEAQVPDATVTGTAATGVTLDFSNDADATFFALRWL